MRSDLNKLLCENPRPRSWDKFGNYRNLKEFNNFGEEGENLPKRESMKARHGEKSFNENLSPLYGMIKANVNRPWDKVYSELRQVFDARSTINAHILQHLYDYVEVNTFEQDGLVFVRPRWSQGAQEIGISSCEYYVHPRTGILLRNRRYKTYAQRYKQAQAERAKVEALVLRRVSDTLEFRRPSPDRPWFICELRKIPETTKTYERDPLTGKTVTKYHRAEYYDRWMGYDEGFRPSTYYSRTTHYVHSCRTASHKELKQYGII